MESPPSERTYAACAINIARVFAHYISYPPPPPPPLNRDINLPHHPPWPTTVNRPSTLPANALARCYYVLQPRSRSMYTDHPRHRDPHSPRSLPIMQVAQNSALPLPMPFLVAAASHHHVAASGTTATTATISTRHHLHPPPTVPTPPIRYSYTTYASYATTVTTLRPAAAAARCRH